MRVVGCEVQDYDVFPGSALAFLSKLKHESKFNKGAKSLKIVFFFVDKTHKRWNKRYKYKD